MFKSSIVKQSIEVVGPHGQDFRIETFKLYGDYFLETSRVIKGIRQDYKTQRYDSKSEMFRYRQLAYSYLRENGVW